jgi:hypothetical protein
MTRYRLISARHRPPQLFPWDLEGSSVKRRAVLLRILLSCQVRSKTTIGQFTVQPICLSVLTILKCKCTKKTRAQSPNLVSDFLVTSIILLLLLCNAKIALALLFYLSSTSTTLSSGRSLIRRPISNPSPRDWSVMALRKSRDILDSLHRGVIAKHSTHSSAPIAGIADFSGYDSGVIEPCGGESGGIGKVRPTTSIGITDCPHASWREEYVRCDPTE